MVCVVGWTQKRLGKELGYSDGQMVGRVLRGESTFPPFVVAKLSKLAQGHGFHGLSNCFKAPAFRHVEVQAGEPNGCFHDELCGLSKTIGKLCEHSQNLDFDHAIHLTSRGMGLFAQWGDELRDRQRINERSSANIGFNKVAA